MSTEQQPERIGPYRIQGVIGRGGMGVVYRGEHEESGEHAAVKTVLVATENQFAGIRREIHALSGVTHPGVVRVVGSGIEGRVPWYAMELLEGETLRDLCAGWTMVDETLVLGDADTEGYVGAGVHATPEPPDPPTELTDDIRRALAVIWRLCGALSYLHGRGMVHCDLKPANVIIRASGQPVLVDFGLASRFAGRKNREALSGRREVEGTSAYMAPEQIRATPVDARTDLYALGCVLYEILTGRPPFIGPTAMAVMLKHLGPRPEPLSALSPWVSAPLENLVMGLLRKEPRDRIGFADIVANMLYETVAELLDDDARRSATEPRAYLYRPELVGRDPALSSATGLIDRLARRQGGVALIEGSSGLGKTRMAQELVRLATARAFQVLTGRSLPMSDRLAEGQSAFRAPLEAFSGVFRTIGDRCLALGKPEIDRLMGPRVRILASYDETLRALPELSSYPRPGTLAGEAAHHRLYGALGDTLVAMASATQVLLVLDDVHWADELTLGFLTHLVRSRRLEAVGLLVVATYRPEEVKPRMAPLLDASVVPRITLGRLAEADVASMIRDMLGLSEIPGAFARMVYERSEGNPFFVAEYLRTAVAIGALTRDRHGQWNISEDDVRELPLPRTLHALSVRRLDGLSPGARHLAKVAAVIGRECREAWLSQAVRMAPRAFMDALGELSSRQILEHRDPNSASERWRFTQDELRRVLLSHIHFNQLAALHRAVAQMLEAQRDPTLTTQLARHWEEAGELDRARHYYLLAARRAAEGFAQEEAERLYRAYLKLAEVPTRESVAARQHLARDVLAMVGRLRDALAEGRQAVDEARALKDPEREAEALIMVARLTRRLGDFEQAREWCRQALLVVRNRGNVHGEVEALNVLGMVYWNQNQFEPAEALYARCLELLKTITAPDLLEDTLGHKALLLWSKGERDEARQMFSRQLELVRRRDDRVKVGRVLGNLASIDRELGDALQAQARFEAALRIHQEVGNRVSQGVTCCNLGMLYADQRQLDLAEQYLSRSVAILREVRHTRGLAVAQGNFAMLRLYQGRPEDARALFEEARGTMGEKGQRRHKAYLHMYMARLERLGYADYEAARELIERAEAIFSGNDNGTYLVLCVCEQGHLDLAQGRDAQAALDRARQLFVNSNPGGGSEQASALQRFDRAFHAQTRGEPLWRGSLVVDLPREMREAFGLNTAP